MAVRQVNMKRFSNPNPFNPVGNNVGGGEAVGNSAMYGGSQGEPTSNLGITSEGGFDATGTYPPQGDGYTTESGYEESVDGNLTHWTMTSDDTGNLSWEQNKVTYSDGSVSITTKNYQRGQQTVSYHDTSGNIVSRQVFIIPSNITHGGSYNPLGSVQLSEDESSWS